MACFSSICTVGLTGEALPPMSAEDTQDFGLALLLSMQMIEAGPLAKVCLRTNRKSISQERIPSALAGGEVNQGISRTAAQVDGFFLASRTTAHLRFPTVHPVPSGPQDALFFHRENGSGRSATLIEANSPRCYCLHSLTSDYSSRITVAGFPPQRSTAARPASRRCPHRRRPPRRWSRPSRQARLCPRTRHPRSGCARRPRH